MKKREKPMSGKDDGCAERVLAKALVQAGARKSPGETVRLRPAQIERLAPRGYFEEPAPAKPRRGDSSTKHQEDQDP